MQYKYFDVRAMLVYNDSQVILENELCHYRQC